jgi:hypothetical protein
MRRHLFAQSAHVANAARRWCISGATVACATSNSAAASVVDRLVAERIATPDAPPLDGLWRELSNGMKLVDAFNHRTMRRRHTSVASMLQFLADHNVLLHSLYRFDDGAKAWNVSKSDFARLCLTGETLLRAEAAQRLHRTFPSLQTDELVALTAEATCAERLVTWYDDHVMKSICRPKAARRAAPPTDDMKVRAVYATLAELNWFVIKTKATDRTHNNALFPPSDALILHVLAAHVVEATLAGLTTEMFLPAVAAAKQRWENHRLSLASQFLAPPRRSKRHDLLIEPLSVPVTLEGSGEDAAPSEVVAQRAEATPPPAEPLGPKLHSAPLAPLRTPQTPTLNWSKLARRHLKASATFESQPQSATLHVAPTPRLAEAAPSGKVDHIG